MYTLLAVLSIFTLILLYPIRYHLYTEDGLKSRLILFGFIRVPINIRKFYRQLVGRGNTRKSDQEEDDFDIMEIVENIKKTLSMRDVSEDLMKKMIVEELNWYSAIPMDNPLLGLSMLPIYTTAQTMLVDYVYNHFGKVKDHDIDTKYNYLTEDVLIYFESIIRFNLLKIIIVSVKYIGKWRILLKRTT